jgi:hypothetical protein
MRMVYRCIYCGHKEPRLWPRVSGDPNGWGSFRGAFELVTRPEALLNPMSPGSGSVGGTRTDEFAYVDAHNGCEMGLTFNRPWR